MNSKKLLKYSKGLGFVFLIASFGIYEIVGYIHSNYPTYEQPGLFQTIYILLAVVAIGFFIAQVIFAIKYKELIWRIVAVLFSLYSFYVIIICLLGFISVNFL